MANIGATTAFYKVETSLTRANNEVSKSMERLATGKQNATAGDRSSYQAMADTFRLDYVATKAGIKGASVVMGYLETAMRTLDAASGVLSRLQELAVLGANETNTTEDAVAIDAEAEALGTEFHRLLNTAKYKGKDLFLAAAGGEYVSLGGRDAEMTFGVKKVQYTELYLHSYLTYASENGVTIGSNDAETTYNAKKDLETAEVVNGRLYQTVIASVALDTDSRELSTFGGPAVTAGALDNASPWADDGTKFTATKSGNTTDGTHLQTGRVVKQIDQLVFAASEGANNGSTDSLTAKIESVQGKINTARVQAGSQYAALESAVGYVTDLTAQYELGYNTVNDVNFSMETAHLAKNQILQQAATAMLAQANQGQQSLLQLIQG
jgi:flagellin